MNKSSGLPSLSVEMRVGPLINWHSPLSFTKFRSLLRNSLDAWLSCHTLQVSLTSPVLIMWVAPRSIDVWRAEIKLSHCAALWPGGLWYTPNKIFLFCAKISNRIHSILLLVLSMPCLLHAGIWFAQYTATPPPLLISLFFKKGFWKPVKVNNSSVI